MPSKRLPPRPDVDHLKHQAKDLRAAHAEGRPDAIRRLKEFHPRLAAATEEAIAAESVTRTDALLTIAREYGFASWPKLKRHVEGLHALECRITDLRAAFAAGDADARRRLLEPAHDVRRFESYDPNASSISDSDARLLIANSEGYAFWEKYESFMHLDPAVQDVIGAVRRGDRDKLLEVLSSDPAAASPHWVPGFKPSQPIANDSVPLFCVSESSFRGTNERGNEYELVQDLARAGADVDFEGGMPFVSAVSYGVPRATEAMLDCGAAIDGVDGDGTPMAYALHFGHSEVAELLARRGAKTDLRFAAGLGALESVKDWFTADGALKPGAGALVDPYAFEHKLRGQSPFRCERTRANILSQALHFACANARLEVAEFLLARGADLDAIVPGLDSRATVLHLLASMEAGRGRTRDNAHRVVRFLAAQGADLDARDEVFRSTPLGWAQFLRRHETADLLRSLGAST